MKKLVLLTDVARLDARPKQFVYFDYSNELVDRLRLLINEKATGNSDSEIASIIEELMELKILNNPTMTKFISYSLISVDPLSHDFSHRIIRVFIGRADFFMRVIYIRSSAVTHACKLFNFYSFKIL